MRGLLLSLGVAIRLMPSLAQAALVRDSNGCCDPSCSGYCPFDGRGTWIGATGSCTDWTCYYSDGHYYAVSCIP